MTADAEGLFPVLATHCFWSPSCDTVVRGTDPDDAHDRMEAHYAADHAEDLATLGLTR